MNRLDPQVQRVLTLLNDARRAGECSAVVGAVGSEVTVMLKSDHVVMPIRPTYLTPEQARALAQRVVQPAQGRIVHGRQTALQFARDLLLVAAAVEHGVLQS
jgi:hypothetical protein